MTPHVDGPGTEKGRTTSSSSDTANIPAHLWSYAQDQDDLARAAVDVRQYLQELAQAASIKIHTIEARAKGLRSYQEKSSKLNDDGSPKYTDPVGEIHDCVAARVIVFTKGARDDLADLLTSRMHVLERQNPGDTKHNGYDSEHLVVSGVIDKGVRLRYPALARFFEKYHGLEIQVRSVAGHAWAEYEHDIRYKSGAFQELSPHGVSQINQWFIEAGGMRRVMDELFDKIEGRLTSSATVDVPVVEDEAPVVVEDDLGEDADARNLDIASLRDFVAERFSDSSSTEVGDATEELLAHLRALNITTTGALDAVLANIEEGEVARLMDYPSAPSATRLLDDEVLASLTDQYIDSAPDENRAQLLRLRLRRVRGKFAIYAVRDATGGLTPPMTAARAVRELVRAVSRHAEPERIEIDSAVTLNRTQLNRSAHARPVHTEAATFYVATNLSRTSAEDIMSTLIDRAPGSRLAVVRAGDVLLEATG